MKSMELLERSTNESGLSTENVGNFSGSIHSVGSRVELECQVLAVPVPVLEFSCEQKEKTGKLRHIKCVEDLNATVKQNVLQDVSLRYKFY